MAGFKNNWVRGADLKEKAHKMSWDTVNFLGKLPKLPPHFFETPMQLWDQIPHRNPFKNGSLSENVMKEGERVLFQPLH